MLDISESMIIIVHGDVGVLRKERLDNGRPGHLPLQDVTTTEWCVLGLNSQLQQQSVLYLVGCEVNDSLIVLSPTLTFG